MAKVDIPFEGDVHAFRIFHRICGKILFDEWQLFPLYLRGTWSRTCKIILFFGVLVHREL